MIDITIGNLRHNEDGIRCDRRSPLGNPFAMRSEEDRIPVIEAFRCYLYRVMERYEQPIDAARTVAAEMDLQICPKWREPSRKQMALLLNGIKLKSRKRPTTILCWCHPDPCHLDIIVSYLRWKDSIECQNSIAS